MSMISASSDILRHLCVCLVYLFLKSVLLQIATPTFINHLVKFPRLSLGELGSQNHVLSVSAIRISTFSFALICRRDGDCSPNNLVLQEMTCELRADMVFVENRKMIHE